MNLPQEGRVRLPSVLAACGISKSTVLRLVAAGRFPPPIAIGSRLNLWDVAAVRAWIADPEMWRAQQ